MSIMNVCFPCCEVINFEINLYFLIKLLLYMTKKSKQKFKYLENEKSFWSEKKAFLKGAFFQGFQLPKIVFDLRVHL